MIKNNVIFDQIIKIEIKFVLRKIKNNFVFCTCFNPNMYFYSNGKMLY